tara:strand:- start:7752 stop:8522 length:771 start_codon:yes stop_codon:yes gene_type:complete
MDFGHYADNKLPIYEPYKDQFVDYVVNEQGYRCRSWTPLPAGKKNSVILGCSHTFGVGLETGQHWADRLSSMTDPRLIRWWNLAQPGASCESIVRILYGCEQVLFPKHIIICWPAINRREKLEVKATNLTGQELELKYENKETDLQNFFKCVFFAERYAKHNQAIIYHCFADEVVDMNHNWNNELTQDLYDFNHRNIVNDRTLKDCYPEWSPIQRETNKRVIVTESNLAKDGLHYGPMHHENFAKCLYSRWKAKLK